jgi:uncharacterized protein (TIGR04255 family)
VEALIDLRVTQEEGFTVEDLAKIRELVADSYPNQSTEYVYSGQIYIEEAGDPLQTEATPQSNGFRFISQDKRHIFYARLDGFVLSVRAPYDRWETFRNEARRLWDLYRSVTKVESITRAAVRYVNQINIPGDQVELDEYFRTSPKVSPGYTHGQLAGFFVQLQLWQEDLNCWLVVNESPAQSPNAQTATILLDLDLFQERFDEPWGVEEDESVWDFLERLRERKNEVFEASITEKTRGLFS